MFWSLAAAFAGPGRPRLRWASLLVTSAWLAGCAAPGGPTGTEGSLPAPAAGNPPPAAPAVARDPQPTAPASAPVAERTPRPAAAVTATVVVPEPPASGPGARYDDLWSRIRGGFAFPELPTPLVAEKERFYLSKPEYLQRMFARGGRYLYYIVEEVEKRGMPTELALLPFVESAMNPVALSPAQAAGLWQFIPSTGRDYNLHQNFWVDNRRDVVESTKAALDYLQKIYAMHGNDWFLALASYNWGEGAVGRAVQKAKARGRSGDYLSLDMPNETRHYVPKLVALKNILQRAPELGLALPPLPNKPYFVTIEKTRPIDLKLAAQFAGMSVDEFVALNPAHNRPVIAASKNNEIKLPADRLDAFLDAIERHGEANRAFATWQPHTMQPGESLDSLAQRGGITVAELQRANGLKPGSRLLPGTRIIAPVGRGNDDETRVEAFVAPRLYEQVDTPAAYHVVGRKETLPGIADRYGVSAATLAAWNGVKKGVKPGMRLMVRPAGSQTLLTTERGDRQVIASQQRAPVVAEPAPAPLAAKSAADEPRKAVETDKAPPAARKAAETEKGSTATRKLAGADSGSRKSAGAGGRADSARAPAVAAATPRKGAAAPATREAGVRAKPVTSRTPVATPTRKGMKLASDGRGDRG